MTDARSLSGFADQTIRQMVRTSAGGSGVRVRLTNAYGEVPVTFERVTVGIRNGGATIVPGSLRPVTFNGTPSVSIRDGARAYSDPVDLDVGPEEDLAVSLYTADPTGPATVHHYGKKTSYVADGDQATDSGGTAYTDTTTARFFLDGLDVITDRQTSAVVCLGDSITDGSSASVDAHTTWPDVLTERMNDRPAIQKTVLNAGIGGNRVLRDSPPGGRLGESALDRLDRDVLTQTDVSHVIFLEGINDIGLPPSASAAAIIDGHRQIIARCKAQGLAVKGATLTPFEGAFYYSEAGEQKRQQVNKFIRTTDRYDGVVDFDKAIRDPNQPKRMQPKYNSGDNLHPSDEGYRAMANAVDLSLLKG
jgi:lysophospholipase L1-like esterase